MGHLLGTVDFAIAEEEALGDYWAIAGAGPVTLPGTPRTTWAPMGLLATGLPRAAMMEEAPPGSTPGAGAPAIETLDQAPAALLCAQASGFVCLRSWKLRHLSWACGGTSEVTLKGHLSHNLLQDRRG